MTPRLNDDPQKETGTGTLPLVAPLCYLFLITVLPLTISLQMNRDPNLNFMKEISLDHLLQSMDHILVP